MCAAEEFHHRGHGEHRGKSISGQSVSRKGAKAQRGSKTEKHLAADDADEADGTQMSLEDELVHGFNFLPSICANL
jgi:hypothetical protein